MVCYLNINNGGALTILSKLPCGLYIPNSIQQYYYFKYRIFIRVCNNKLLSDAVREKFLWRQGCTSVDFVGSAVDRTLLTFTERCQMVKIQDVPVWIPSR
jgi:hypothetical protein